MPKHISPNQTLIHRLRRGWSTGIINAIDITDGADPQVLWAMELLAQVHETVLPTLLELCPPSQQISQAELLDHAQNIAHAAAVLLHYRRDDDQEG